MKEEFLSTISWDQPWFKNLRDLRRVQANSDWRFEMNRVAIERGLVTACSHPLQFVPQAELQSRIGYESFIYETGRVPSRENLHDFFNALIWLNYPNTKQRLNFLQANEINRRNQTFDGLPKQATRGQLRDAGTIFDENGLLFVTSEPDWYRLLRAHAWKQIFVERRQEFQRSCEIWVFGHALLEKLASPYKAITGHALLIHVEPTFFLKSVGEKGSELDSMASVLLTEHLRTADFAPLPVLGIPGWWPCQEASFYDDESVFRPLRKKPR